MNTSTVCVLVAVFVCASVSGSNNNQDICLQNSQKCFIDPCLVAECPGYSTAVCRANYCDGCNAEFFEAGQKVNCTVIGK